MPKPAKPTPRHAGGAPRTVRRCRLGQRLEALADARGLHLDELAAAAGITNATLHRICTGRIQSPKLDTVRALAGVLEVSLDALAE